MTLNTDALMRDIKVRLKVWSSCLFERAVPSQPVDNSLTKSTTKANEFREVGNKLHKEKKFEDALFPYTASIAYALDINRALKGHCPNLLKQKLHDRKKRCLTLIKSSTGAKGDANGEIDEDATSPPTDREPSWRADLLSRFGNPLLPNASPKIKLKYDEKWGRHFVATTDIEPGEPLISENYFTTVSFLGDSRYKYCDLCIEKCDALIPCLSCVTTMYCSEQCRTQAYNSYHRTECKLSIFPSDSEGRNIAIRMFLIGTRQGAELENLMNTLSIADIFTKNFDFSDKFTSSDYLTALRSTYEAFDRIREKSRIKDAIEVIIELRKLAFFENFPASRSTDAEIFATALLLNNYSKRFISRFNSTGCRSTQIIEKGGLTHGLKILLNFFNHSCFPNVGGYLRKQEQIMFAIRPIKKDEQLFITYFGDFVNNPKTERTRYMLDFTCWCEACSNNWPTYSESSIPSMTSLGEMWTRMIQEDFIPSNDARERGRVLSEAVDVVAPLLDDTTIAHFRIKEILPIIAKMISLLHKVMVPLSFCLVELRRYLCYLIQLYYDERECDPTIQIQNSKFPESVVGMMTEDPWMTAEPSTLTERLLCLRFAITMIDAICRVKFYVSLFD